MITIIWARTTATSSHREGHDDKKQGDQQQEGGMQDECTCPNVTSKTMRLHNIPSGTGSFRAGVEHVPLRNRNCMRVRTARALRCLRACAWNAIQTAGA
eukprot:1242165-Pyramimonas_sp.AAC.1